MKKLLIIFLLFSYIKVVAYENDYYKIEIPEDYELSINSNTVNKWENDNNSIIISIDNNKKINIVSLSTEEIDNLKSTIEKNINEGLKDYNLTAKVISTDKKNNSNFYYLQYSVYIPSKKEIGFDTYQKGSLCSKNNYMLTITYSSDKEIKEDDFNNIINTLILKDIKETHITLRSLIYLAIIVGSVCGIIGYFISLKKEKK